MKIILATKRSITSKRSMRQFIPEIPGGLRGCLLESRKLTVPVFIRSQPFPGAEYLAGATSNVPGDLGPVSNSFDSNSPTPGPTASSSAQSTFQGIAEAVAGTVTNSGVVPTGSTSNLRAFEIVVGHSHNISGNSFGEVNGSVEQITTASGNDAWQMADSAPGPLGNGTATVVFTITINAAARGTVRDFSMQFASPFINVQAGGNGLAVNDAHGHVLVNNSAFGANGNSGSYSVSFDVPITSANANVGIAYNSEFWTREQGYKGVSAGDTPFMGWSVSVSTNN